jgi:CheY-like chemotaxis protein
MKKYSPQPAPWAPRQSSPARAKELLLYVEDDDDNWMVAELRLRNTYELVRAASAEQACRLLAQRGEEFAAILMDIELRGSDLNGVELTQFLRGKSRRTQLPAYTKAVPVLSVPILFVTAHGAKYTDELLLQAGANKVIPKPINFGELNLALTQLHLERVRPR